MSKGAGAWSRTRSRLGKNFSGGLFLLVLALMLFSEKAKTEDFRPSPLEETDGKKSNYEFDDFKDQVPEHETNSPFGFVPSNEYGHASQIAGFEIHTEDTAGTDQHGLEDDKFEDESFERDIFYNFEHEEKQMDLEERMEPGHDSETEDLPGGGKRASGEFGLLRGESSEDASLEDAAPEALGNRDSAPRRSGDAGIGGTEESEKKATALQGELGAAQASSTPGDPSGAGGASAGGEPGPVRALGEGASGETLNLTSGPPSESGQAPGRAEVPDSAPESGPKVDNADPVSREARNRPRQKSLKKAVSRGKSGRSRKTGDFALKKVGKSSRASEDSPREEGGEPSGPSRQNTRFKPGKPSKDGNSLPEPGDAASGPATSLQSPDRCLNLNKGLLLEVFKASEEAGLSDCSLHAVHHWRPGGTLRTPEHPSECPGPPLFGAVTEARRPGVCSAEGDLGGSPGTRAIPSLISASREKTQLGGKRNGSPGPEPPFPTAEAPSPGHAAVTPAATATTTPAATTSAATATTATTATSTTTAAATTAAAAATAAVTISSLGSASDSADFKAPKTPPPGVGKGEASDLRSPASTAEGGGANPEQGSGSKASGKAAKRERRASSSGWRAAALKVTGFLSPNYGPSAPPAWKPPNQVRPPGNRLQGPGHGGGQEARTRWEQGQSAAKPHLEGRGGLPNPAKLVLRRLLRGGPSSSPDHLRANRESGGEQRGAAPPLQRPDEVCQVPLLLKLRESRDSESDSSQAPSLGVLAGDPDASLPSLPPREKVEN
ncbi:hypothetical protein HWI79_3677 [Cryptosporidium felis]|nr:hypothetical protein HWI79_3677 [Cryptosporidium felis]